MGLLISATRISRAWSQELLLYLLTPVLGLAVLAVQICLLADKDASLERCFFGQM
jgi:hypothetical protein